MNGGCSVFAEDASSATSRSLALATGLSICESSQRSSRASPESVACHLESLSLRVSALKLAVQPALGNTRDGDLAAVGASKWVACKGSYSCAFASGARTTSMSSQLAHACNFSCRSSADFRCNKTLKALCACVSLLLKSPWRLATPIHMACCARVKATYNKRMSSWRRSSAVRSESSLSSLKLETKGKNTKGYCKPLAL